MDADKLITGRYATREVSIASVRLSPRRSQAVINHSPDGFNWGYGGSGAAQFALWLLSEFTDERTARTLYQIFKWEVIAKLPASDFTLRAVDVSAWLQAQKVPVQS